MLSYGSELWGLTTATIKILDSLKIRMEGTRTDCMRSMGNQKSQLTRHLHRLDDARIPKSVFKGKADGRRPAEKSRKMETEIVGDKFLSEPRKRTVALGRRNKHL